MKSHEWVSRSFAQHILRANGARVTCLVFVFVTTKSAKVGVRATEELCL